MSFETVGWSVVLIGKWNKAILSPKGIAQHVFRLPSGTKIPINVPLDGVSAYLVRNPEETLSVHVESERLQIDVLKCTYDVLEQALKAGVNVLDALPVTPISAIGFNVNFKSAEARTELISAMECGIDAKVAVNGFDLIGKLSGRTLRFNEGVINLTVLWTNEEYQVNFNFHLETSDKEKGKTWLNTPLESIKDIIRKISRLLDMDFVEGFDA